MTYDPPVNDASDLKTVKVTPTEAGQDEYFLQAEPARKLKNLLNIPAVLVTSEASYHVPYDPGTVAFLRQAGVTLDHIELPKIGIKGNAHFMMMEKNNREVLQPVLDWISAKVEKNVARVNSAHAGETAMKLADTGIFWVGAEKKKMPYGEIVAGQMFVQYLTPRQVRHPYPIVLVHGGGAQMLHFMGQGDGEAGWAHYFVQAGYRVYLIDRPGHGRAPYHPDALGPISSVPTYESILADFKRTASGAHKRWQGTAEIGNDARLDQLLRPAKRRPARQRRHAKDVGRGRRGTARQNRPRRIPDALRRGTLWIPGRQSAPQASQRNRSRRRRFARGRSVPARKLSRLPHRAGHG